MAIDGRKANLSPEAAGYIARLEERLARIQKNLNVALSSVIFLKNKTSGYISKMKPGQDGVPYAQASGIESPAAFATLYTVNFPTGRFSVSPLVNVSIQSPSSTSVGTIAFVLPPTPDSFQYRVDGGTYNSGLRVVWTAIQMTTDTANG